MTEIEIDEAKLERELEQYRKLIGAWVELAPKFEYYPVSSDCTFFKRISYLLKNATRSALTNATGQVVHPLNNTATQFAAHPSAVSASGLPIAAAVGFVPGLLMGFKKG